MFTVYRWNYRGNLPTEYSVGNSVGKNNTSSFFFLLCFKFFSHGNSVGKIPRKFTDENIPSVFPFVFNNFLVVVLVRLRPERFPPGSFTKLHAHRVGPFQVTKNWVLLPTSLIYPLILVLVPFLTLKILQSSRAMSTILLQYQFRP